MAPLVVELSQQSTETLGRHETYFRDRDRWTQIHCMCSGKRKEKGKEEKRKFPGSYFFPATVKTLVLFRNGLLCNMIFLK